MIFLSQNIYQMEFILICGIETIRSNIFTMHRSVNSILRMPSLNGNPIDKWPKDTLFLCGSNSLIRVFIWYKMYYILPNKCTFKNVFLKNIKKKDPPYTSFLYIGHVLKYPSSLKIKHLRT